MRFFKIKSFQRDLKDNELEDENLKILIDDILNGRAAPIGAKLYKIRGAIEGKGKRGGFRSIFFWKKDDFIVFCLLFTKNEQDDISAEENKALRILSKEFDNLNEYDIDRKIADNRFMEIKYENK